MNSTDYHAGGLAAIQSMQSGCPNIWKLVEAVLYAGNIMRRSVLSRTAQNGRQLGKVFGAWPPFDLVYHSIESCQH